MRLGLLLGLLSVAFADLDFIACSPMHRKDVLNFYPEINITLDQPSVVLAASIGDAAFLLFQGSEATNQFLGIDLKHWIVNSEFVNGGLITNTDYPVATSLAVDQNYFYLLQASREYLDKGLMLVKYDRRLNRVVSTILFGDLQSYKGGANMKLDPFGALHVLARFGDRLHLTRVQSSGFLNVTNDNTNLEILGGSSKKVLAIDQEKANFGAYAYFTDLTLFRTNDDATVSTYKSPQPIEFIPEGNLQTTMYLASYQDIQSLSSMENRLLKTLDFSNINENAVRVTFGFVSSRDVAYWAFATSTEPLIVRTSSSLDVLDVYNMRSDLILPQEQATTVVWMSYDEDRDMLYVLNSVQQMYRIEGAGCQFALPWPLWALTSVIGLMIFMAIMGNIFRKIVGPYQKENPIQVTLLQDQM